MCNTCTRTCTHAHARAHRPRIRDWTHVTARSHVKGPPPAKQLLKGAGQGRGPSTHLLTPNAW